MSFLKIINFKHDSHYVETYDKNTLTLQAQSVFTSVAYTDNTYISYNYSKRMSPISRTTIPAGITVEAALAIPIFIFFMVNLISIINIFNRYGEKLSQAQQIVRLESYMCFVAEGSGSEEVSCSKIVPIIPWFEEIGYNSASTVAYMTYRKWTGYDVNTSTSSNETEEYVYITNYGYSYHKNRGCSHLKINIEVVGTNEIDVKRNNSGARYYACEKCGGQSSGLLFITGEGDKYHSNANCSGLKRTVRAVKLSAVDGRTACSECGG